MDKLELLKKHLEEKEKMFTTLLVECEEKYVDAMSIYEDTYSMGARLTADAYKVRIEKYEYALNELNTIKMLMEV